MLLITKKKLDDLVLVTLSGSLSMHSHDDLHTTIVECTEGHGDNILLSLESLEQISSSGVGILVTACVEIGNSGRIIKLVDVPTEILEKLDMHKVLPVFNIFSDVESAAKQIKIDVEEKDKALVRLFERIDLCVGARFRVHKRGKKVVALPFQDATAMGLNKRGMFLRTEQLFDANTLIDVKLSLGKGFFKKESVSFLGKVVRMIEAVDDAEAGFGLVILHMDHSETKRLEKFLKKQ